MSYLDRAQGQLAQVAARFPYATSILDAGRTQARQRPKLLKALAGLVLVYGLNKTLNAVARNHWYVRKCNGYLL